MSDPESFGHKVEEQLFPQGKYSKRFFFFSLAFSVV